MTTFSVSMTNHQDLVTSTQSKNDHFDNCLIQSLKQINFSDIGFLYQKSKQLGVGSWKIFPLYFKPNCQTSKKVFRWIILANLISAGNAVFIVLGKPLYTVIPGTNTSITDPPISISGAQKPSNLVATPRCSISLITRSTFQDPQGNFYAPSLNKLTSSWIISGTQEVINMAFQNLVFEGKKENISSSFQIFCFQGVYEAKPLNITLSGNYYPPTPASTNGSVVMTPNFSLSQISNTSAALFTPATLTSNYTFYQMPNLSQTSFLPSPNALNSFQAGLIALASIALACSVLAFVVFMRRRLKEPPLPIDKGNNLDALQGVQPNKYGPAPPERQDANAHSGYNQYPRSNFVFDSEGLGKSNYVQAPAPQHINPSTQELSSNFRFPTAPIDPQPLSSNQLQIQYDIVPNISDPFNDALEKSDANDEN